MRLARRQDEIDKAARGVAHTNDLGAEAAPRSSQRFGGGAGAAIESQTQWRSLRECAPLAF